MARLELRFFGTPAIRLDGSAVGLDRRKAEALLAYLVVEGRPYRRSELAVLLWPEQTSASARAAFRRTLFALTEAVGKEWLILDRDCVEVRRSVSGGLRLWSDVGAFQALLTRAREHSHGDGVVCPDCVTRVTEAVRLHRADFLEGLTLRDAPAFDEWQHLQTERFRELRGRAIESLVDFHTARGAHDEALGWARERVSQDPLDEVAHEALLVTLLAAGRRGSALRLYEAYERRLEQELGMEPPASMRELLRRPHPESRAASEVRAAARAPRALDDRFTAWRAACERGDVAFLDRSLERFHGFADLRGFYRAGIEHLELGLGAADEPTLVGRLLARQGALYSCIGQLQKARALIVEGLRSARESGDVADVAFCQNRLGCVLFAEGDYARSKRLLRGSVSSYRETSSSTGLPWALNVWGHLSIGSRQARKLLTESLERAERAGDAQRIASTLNSLGKEALMRGELAAAERELKQSLERRREHEHRIGIADTLTNLGFTYVALRRERAARRAFDEAFGIAREIDARPLLAEILLGMAELALVETSNEHAVELGSAALHLPGGWRDAKDRARTRLDVFAAGLATEVAARALRKGERAVFSSSGGPGGSGCRLI